MDPRSNSYIIQQLPSRYVPNFPLQYSGNSRVQHPQNFPSSNHNFNTSPSRDRAFNPQVHIRPPAPAVVPPQIREVTYSNNGQIFNPNSRYLSSRMPNFSPNMDCLNYAQRRGHPLRMQEHDRERYSSTHESPRSNPEWSSKVLDDHRIRCGPREDNRMNVHRFGGPSRVSLGGENVDIGFSSPSMPKGDYKSEGKRGNFEGDAWVSMKQQAFSRQHQRKSALQRIQKPVYERLEEKPLSFTSTPGSEDFEKLPSNVHSSFSSHPSQFHYNFKPKSSFNDHPAFSKHKSPSKLRSRSARKRIQREYERSHVGKARKHDGSEPSFEPLLTLNRSDIIPKCKGKNLREYVASEDCGSDAVAAILKATGKDALTAKHQNFSPSDFRLEKELDCKSTYVGSLNSSPMSPGKLKRVKTAPDSPDPYAKRSRNNAEHSKMEETSKRLFSEDKISVVGNFAVDLEGKNTGNKNQIGFTPFDINVIATNSESFPFSPHLIKNEKVLDSLFLNRDSGGELTKNYVNFESSPSDGTYHVVNSKLDLKSPDSNAKAVDTLLLETNDGEKLVKNGVEMESMFNIEERGIRRTEFGLGSPDTSKKITNVGDGRNEVKNLQNLVCDIMSCNQEVRSPEKAEAHMTSIGVFTVEAELNISNVARTQELPHSFSLTLLDEIVVSPEKLHLSEDNKTEGKLVKDGEANKTCIQDLNLEMNEEMRMILGSEVLQKSFDDETQRTMLNMPSQATSHTVADSPNRKSSSEALKPSFNHETQEIIPAMDHKSYVENIAHSAFQEILPEALQKTLNDVTQRTISIIADSPPQNGSSVDFSNEPNDETLSLSIKNRQSSVEKFPDSTSQVCLFESFHNSVNKEIQRTISKSDHHPTEERPTDFPTQRSNANTNHQFPTEKSADSAPPKSSSAQDHHTPSNSSSLISSGSLSSSESIPTSNSLQQTKRPSNSLFSEEPQKDKQASFKKPPSSKYSTKPRTWHRPPDSSVPPTTTAPSSSYIRKGNSLIRKPNATSFEPFISPSSEDPQATSPENTNSISKSITYVKRKANQLIASVSDIDHDIIPISTHKKPRKSKKQARKAARKYTPITKQLVPWKWTSYRRKTLLQIQPTADEVADFSKSKHKLKTLSGDHNYIRIGKGNKLVRATNKRTRILANEKIRWSLHTVRSRMSKKRKYCKFYTRFGKCNKSDGKCPYLHDRSKVAICTKFLSGLCNDPRCILTHKVMPERMPDCSYFSQNLCNNSCCPYRHVHVDPGAESCQAFLRGFCADADECLMKHSYDCPKYAETGSCEMGLKCKLNHPTVKGKGWRNQRLGLSGVHGRYFDVIPMSVSESVRVEKNENLPDFISIDHCHDVCFDLDDDVDNGSIFPFRVIKATK